MKSVETKFAEVLTSMSETQQQQFFAERTRLKARSGKTPAIEVQLNVCESIKSGTFKETARIAKHNGRFTESITESAWTPIQERQVAAYVAGGMSQLEAEVAAGVHDQAIREGVMTGKSVAQVVESLKK